MRVIQCLLNRASGLADRYVSGLAALLKRLHVIDGGVAEEFPLMFVEGRRQARECGVAGIEPARPLKAVPWLHLDNDVSTGRVRGEVRRHHSPEPRKHRCNSE